MNPIPANLKIYHISHANNLAGVAASGKLYSDAECRRRAFACDVVGMSAIKQRRLTEIAVDCHPGTTVGEYVPFYFCSRSITLYILHMNNHPDLVYHGGQRPIVHLQSDLNAVIQWADDHQIRWAFSDSNAGAYYTHFYNRYNALGIIDWDAVASSDFRETRVKDAKQAEFLVFGSFPWTLVEKIGVMDSAMASDVQKELQNAAWCPPIEVKFGWYY